MIIEGIFNIDIQDQQKLPLDLNQINLLVYQHLAPAVSSLLVQFNHSIQILNTKTGADSYFYLLVLLLTVYENMLGY